MKKIRCPQISYSNVKAAANRSASERFMPLLLNHELDLESDTSRGLSYQSHFEIQKKKLKEGDILLRLETLVANTRIFLNEEDLGVIPAGEDGLEISVKSHLVEGSNTITLCMEETEGHPARSQNLFLPSVSLIFLPIGGLLSITLTCLFDAIYSNAHMNVQCCFDTSAVSGTLERTLRWYLYEPGKADIFASSSPIHISLDGEINPVFESEVSVASPRMWSHEDPFLYNLVVEVSDEVGDVVDVRCVAWAARQVENFAINGESVALKGVNYQGLQTRKIIESDLRLMKQLNINALYCRDYPVPRDVYEVTDKLGLYVICQLPLGMNDSSEQIEEKIQALRHHPSIIMWHVPDKDWPSERVHAIQKSINEIDDSRLILSSADNSSLSEVFALPTEWKRLFHEFFPLLDNHASGIFPLDFMDRIHSDEVSWGLVNGERNQKAETAMVKSLFAPVDIEAVDIEKGFFTVTNHHVFISLADYSIDWNLKRDGLVVAEGMVQQPNIASASQRRINIFRELSSFPGRGEGLLTFSFQLKNVNTWAEKGHNIAVLQIPVPEVEHDSLSDSALEMEQKDEEVVWTYNIHKTDILVVGGRTGVRINTKEAGIDALDFGLGNVLSGSLQPDIRVESQHDSALSLTVNDYKIRKKKDSLEIVMKLQADVSSAPFKFTVGFMPNGEIALSLTAPSKIVMKFFGIRLGLHFEYSRISWYGDGPFPAYEGVPGMLLGIYTMDTHKLEKMSLRQDFRMHSHVRWIRCSGGGGKILIRGEKKNLRFFAEGKQSPSLVIESEKNKVRPHFSSLLGTDYQKVSFRIKADV